MNWMYWIEIEMKSLKLANIWKLMMDQICAVIYHESNMYDIDTYDMQFLTIFNYKEFFAN